MPNVTVILCTYNSQDRVRRTIQSILNQDYPDFELIILDDCSTNNTVAMIREFDDPRIHLHVNETNQGVAANRNEGIRRAQSQYVAFCDHDDVWATNKLSRQVAALDAEANAGLCGAGYDVYRDGKLRERVRFASNAPTYLHWSLFVRATFLHSTIMVRRSTILRNEILYDSSLDFADDWDVYHKVAQVAPLACVNEPLVDYHLHGKNWSLLANDKMNTRGADFLLGRLGQVMYAGERLQAHYFRAVVLGKTMNNASDVLAIGQALAELQENFLKVCEGQVEAQRAIIDETSNLWWRIVRNHAINAAGMGALSLYGQVPAIASRRPVSPVRWSHTLVVGSLRRLVGRKHPTAGAVSP